MFGPALSRMITSLIYLIWLTECWDCCENKPRFVEQCTTSLDLAQLFKSKRQKKDIYVYPPTCDNIKQKWHKTLDLIPLGMWQKGLQFYHSRQHLFVYSIVSKERKKLMNWFLFTSFFSKINEEKTALSFVCSGSVWSNRVSSQMFSVLFGTLECGFCLVFTFKRRN